MRGSSRSPRLLMAIRPTRHSTVSHISWQSWSPWLACRVSIVSELRVPLSHRRHAEEMKRRAHGKTHPNFGYGALVFPGSTDRCRGRDLSLPLAALAGSKTLAQRIPQLYRRRAPSCHPPVCPSVHLSPTPQMNVHLSPKQCLLWA